MAAKRRGRLKRRRKMNIPHFPVISMVKKIRFIIPFMLPLIFGMIIPLIVIGFQQDKTPVHDPNITDFEQGEKIISIYNAKTGEVFYQPIEEYISAVVSAEMPASFEIEALKAQAVAARTYTLYKSKSTDKSAHKGADVCTDFTHCKAYADEATCRERFGENYDYYRSRIVEAVKATEGEILCYQGEPILAVFHAMSSGKTENAKDVWGGEKPYLVSVDSTGDLTATGYESKKTINPEGLLAVLEKAGYKPDRNVASEAAIGTPVYTEGGSIKEISLYGVTLAGTKIRELFELRSAHFTIAYENGNFDFTVQGYGHGVGMSQQGANAMAKQGKTYKEILSWYYQNTTLARQVESGV